MNSNELAILEKLAIHEARQSFWAYRQFMNPKMKLGWFQRDAAHHLQQFWVDYCDNKKPKLVLESPPQMGKSSMLIDFISWAAGKNPDIKAIYTSVSDRLGVRANLRLQRIYDSEKYKKTFPETRINSANNLSTNGQYLRNREIIEYINRDGYFRNTTVGGAIVGESLDWGLIDDPIKNREQAGSVVIRNKTWDWFTDDFLTRFSENGAMLAILTRWHIDDPIGRLLKQDPTVKVISYPAIAVKDEKYRKIGDALFPEHKSIEFLLKQKSIMPASSWEALYQQNPIIIGGEIIKGKDFVRYKILPKIKYRIIFGDTAMKTQERNDYSVFECWGAGEDGKIYLIDLIRGRWESPELRRRAIDFWNKHKAFDSTLGTLRSMDIEDKASGTGLIQELKHTNKIPVKAIPREKDKLTRVLDVLPQIEAGFVCIPEEATFVADFLAECEQFTADDTHQFDDQIDPMCDAINKILVSYNKHEPSVRVAE